MQSQDDNEWKPDEKLNRTFFHKLPGGLIKDVDNDPEGFKTKLDESDANSAFRKEYEFANGDYRWLSFCAFLVSYIIWYFASVNRVDNQRI